MAKKKAAKKQAPKKRQSSKMDINETAALVVAISTGSKIHEGRAVKAWVDSMGGVRTGIVPVIGGSPQSVYGQYDKPKVTTAFRERLTRAGYGFYSGIVAPHPVKENAGCEELKIENDILKEENQKYKSEITRLKTELSDLKDRYIFIQDEYIGMFKMSERK